MQHAELTFVKGEAGEYHRVWIQPDGREAVGLDLHVQHDLPHLVVESLLEIEDGLWGSLVADGSYPGLTDGHVVGKALTNAIVGASRFGAPSVEGVLAALSYGQHPERASRRSFDVAVAERWSAVIAAQVARLDDSLVVAASERLAVLRARWARTAVGDVLRLEWPLA